MISRTLRVTINGTGFAGNYTAACYGLIPHKNGVAIELAGVTSGRIERAQAFAKEKGITKVVFDRGGYLYHGRVKALAEAANAAGLKCCQPKHPPKVEEAPKAKATAPSEGKKEKPKKAEKAEKTEKPAKAEKQQPAE